MAKLSELETIDEGELQEVYNEWDIDVNALMKVNIRKLAFGFILFVILLLVGLLFYTQVQASSPEPYIVNMWWAYCVDHTTPFFVKPDSFPFSNPEYNYLEVSCMTMNANYQWKESWWRHCQGVSPQVRHRWVSPWSVLIGCFDEIGVGEQ